MTNTLDALRLCTYSVSKGALWALFAPLAATLAALAAPTAEEVDGRWQLTVPEGESYTMTAEDVAQIGNRPFQKAGGGLLVTGDEMGAHTGDVYILDGLYRNTSNLSLGSTNAPMGHVYVQGGTLVNTLPGNPHVNKMAIPRALYLQGEGYRGLGAISNVVFCQNIGKDIVFQGDTKLAGTATFNFRYDTVDMAGHTIVTAFPSDSGLAFVATKVRHPGDIDVRKGFFCFESGTGDDGTSAQKITFAEGAFLRLTVQALLERTFIFADKARIENDSWDGLMFIPATGYHGSKKTGMLAGPTILQGALACSSRVGQGVSFTGPVSGPGGFAFDKPGCWLRLTNPGNSFAGGVRVTGISGTGDLCVTGGLALAANGALPVNEKPLKLTNALLGLYTDTAVDLPALEFDGKVVVTGDVGRTSSRAASLTKTGEGPLTVFGPLAIAGATDVRKGTLRFATRVPDYLPGLHYAYDTASRIYNQDKIYTPEQLQGLSFYRNIDPMGASNAYRPWQNTVATTNVNPQTGEKRIDWHYDHYYAGYIRIPGEEGADVNCRFISCIHRCQKIVVDGTPVFHVSDARVVVPADFVDPGANLGWTRHAWSAVVPLKAGWHQIYIYMGNHYQDGGPKGCSDPVYGLWPKNFGLGVNFNAHEVDDWNTKTNAQFYAKFLGTGDESFFRTSTNVLDKLARDPAAFRPTFEGPVAFASGTTLDIGDAVPYVPVAAPSLTGVPTILNGRLAVASSTWTLRAADVTGGTPLTIGPAAELAFPDGDVVVEMPAPELELLEASRRDAPFVLMAAAEGAALPANGFKPSAALKASAWRLVREGGRLSLASGRGLGLILR